MRASFRVALGLFIMLVVGEATEGCTGIYAFQNGQALAGNNEDYWNPNTKIWFVPAENGTYGRVYFGFDNLFPQGGMNGEGLFFDGFATKAVPVVSSRGKKPFNGNVLDHIMAKCATVDEVIAEFKKYDLRFLERAMLFYADRHGNSVIIEGDEFVHKKGRYQVVTNFYQSHSAPEEYTCPRYKRADAMLRENEEISVDLFQKVLDAVHVQGQARTLYSNICDLTKRQIYLYHFHNYENVVVLDLATELKKGQRVIDIPSLFPEDPAWVAFEKKQREELEKRRNEMKSEAPAPAVLDEYVGRYAVDLGGAVRELQVVRDADRLFVLANEQPRVEVLPSKSDRFFLLDYFGETTFTFQRSPHGKVAALVVGRAGQEYTARRVTRNR